MKSLARLLHALLTVFLGGFLEGEGGLADTCLGGLVVYLVDVGADSGDLGLDFSDNLFHLLCVLIVMTNSSKALFVSSGNPLRKPRQYECIRYCH